MPEIVEKMKKEHVVAVNTLPLTQNQTAIWLDEIFYGASSMYNIGAYYEIRGDFRPEVFASALSRVISESDALGISIHQTQDGLAEQVFSMHEGYALPVLDFSGSEQPVSACLDWIEDRFQSVRHRCMTLPC
jgi:nonribosomal peptide synthetase DhbF